MTETFNFCQHNIGCVEYFDSGNENDKSRFVSSNDTYRDLKSYLSNTEFEADLYTLQEIQHYGNNDGEITVNETKYGYIYNETGKNDYYVNSRSGISANSKEIEHGCMVVYDMNRFEYVYQYTTAEHAELNSRASPWVVLKDKITGKHYLVISIHGLIPNPLSKSKCKRIKDLYESIIDMIAGFYSVTKNDYSFIIGTDLNINIYNPDLDFFSSKKKEFKKSIKKSINYFLKSLKKYNINYDLNNDIYTNYSGKGNNVFYDCIDFIFKSKFLHMKLHMVVIILVPLQNGEN